MLQQEIQIVMKMDHPNIAKYHKVFYDNQYINIVMELIPGKSLSDFVMEQPTQKIGEAECQTIFRQAM